MASLLHFEEKVHRKKLQRADDVASGVGTVEGAVGAGGMISVGISACCAYGGCSSCGGFGGVGISGAPGGAT